MPRGSARYFQRFAVWTQFVPFTLLYRFLYWVAVRVCARRLGRLPGVLCVYLRRGLTNGRPVYGLSDIDLLVLVGSQDRDRNEARVRNRYESLRRVIPMLVEGELAVYDPEQFRALYTHSPFYRGRFDAGRRDWRRLWGEDVFSHLPPPYDSREYLASFELHPLWRYLSQELLPGDRRPVYIRRYVAFKMIADAATLSLTASGDHGVRNREDALVGAAGLHPRLGDRLRQVAAWRDNLLSPDDLPVDDALDTYRKLADATLRGVPDRPLQSRKLRIRALPPGELERQLGEGARSAIQEACGAIDEVERAIVAPRLNFDPLATVGLEPAQFAGATIDSFDLILVGKRLPPVERLREFNGRLRHLGPRLNAFFCDGELALALQPVSGWTIRDPRTAPEFFAYVAETPANGPVAIAGAICVVQPFELSGSLQVRARTLLSLFQQPEIFRMSARDFFVVFWEALRAAYVALQDGDPVAEVPVTSQQVVDALATITASEESALRMILEEFSKDLRNEPSGLFRCTHWASEYAGKLLQLVDHSQNGTKKLPEQPMAELSMSVIIVTRNRAELLGRALQSLVKQDRRPDEVIVVDNASTDATAAVARSFQGTLGLKLVREDRIGIPHARNTGLKHATGDIIAFIDDDCEAGSAWLAEIEKPFLKDPHIASVGGNLVPAANQPELVARFYRSRMYPESAPEGSHIK